MRNFKTQGSLSTLSGSGMRDRPYATVLVAAVDSVAIGAGNADYVCTGTNDHIKIQQAIDICVNGGRVELLEGTYRLDPNYVSIPGNTSVSGQGVGTKLSFYSPTGVGVEVSGGLSFVHFFVEEVGEEGNFFCWSGEGVIDNITYSVGGFEA